MRAVGLEVGIVMSDVGGYKSVGALLK